MRLLHSTTLQLEDFIGDEHVPPYAILSHTWGDGEVFYGDLNRDGYRERLGFRKINYYCD